MPPYQAGSNMAHDVDLEEADYSSGALKFGAGTPNVSGPVGLAAAIRFIEAAGAAGINRFGVTRAARASLYLYSTVEGVDRLADALSEIPRRESR